MPIMDEIVVKRARDKQRVTFALPTVIGDNHYSPAFNSQPTSHEDRHLTPAQNYLVCELTKDARIAWVATLKDYLIVTFATNIGDDIATDSAVASVVKALQNFYERLSCRFDATYEDLYDSSGESVLKACIKLLPQLEPAHLHTLQNEISIHLYAQRH
ncbi:MAG TPA: hypothetical protein VFM68_02535 [Candidatus Saccharimonadales bacterium]|nr:hypothetical protein [Candidatus Saccharimonadales bacterium]